MSTGEHEREVAGAPAGGARPARRWIAAVLATAALAAACSSGKQAQPQVLDKTRDPAGTLAPGASTTSTTPASTVPPDDSASKVPMTGYKAVYTTGACPFADRPTGDVEVECGTLAVPESRTDPKSRTIKLAVGVLRSPNPDPRPDPIVYLEGGPGGSALAGAEELWTSPPSPLLADRDVILLDQRGTGYSQPRLTCEQEQYGAIGNYQQFDVSALTACVGRLRRQEVNLGAYNTDESAADVEDLRRALGIGSWNVLGVSYGTRLAMTYLQQHPSGIRSVVLDSAYPPGAPVDRIPVTFTEAVRNLAADCATQPACAAYGDVEANLLSAIGRLNASPAYVRVVDPVDGPVSGSIDGDTFANMVFDLLYQAPIIPDLPRIIHAFATGDAQTGATLAFRSRAEVQSSTTTTYDPRAADELRRRYNRPYLSEGLYYTVECAESVWHSSDEAIDAAAASIPAPIARAVASDLHGIIESCVDWKVVQRQLDPAGGDVPTLVFGGRYDPITPPAWGEEAAAAIAGARFVPIPFSGHAVIGAGTCPSEMMVRFFDDPASMGGDDCGAAPPTFTTG